MIEKIQIIPNDFQESFESMPLESVGRLTLALFRYANDEDVKEILNGDQIAKAIFPTLKAHIERHEEYRKTKAESGRKGGKVGGAAIGNQNASKTKQNKAKQSKTEQNKPPYPNPNPYPNPLIKDILSFLNANTGKNYKDSKETVRLINARIEEGYTLEDYKTVITKKCNEWKNDSKMSGFLRPSTLFAPSHFDEYLNQPDKATPQGDKQYQQMMKTTYNMTELEAKLIKN